MPTSHRYRALVYSLALLFYFNCALAFVPDSTNGEINHFQCTAQSFETQSVLVSTKDQCLDQRNNTEERYVGTTILWQLSDLFADLPHSDKLNGSTLGAGRVVHQARTWPLFIQDAGKVGLVIAYQESGSSNDILITTIVHPGCISALRSRKTGIQTAQLPVLTSLQTSVLTVGSVFNEVPANVTWQHNVNNRGKHAPRGNTTHDGLIAEHRLRFSPDMTFSRHAEGAANTAEAHIKIRWIITISNRAMAENFIGSYEQSKTRHVANIE